MANIKNAPIIYKIRDEQLQGHATRRHLFNRLENLLKIPLVTFFTSFRYPVMIENQDADMLEGILQRTDLSRGLLLFVDSPGGDGLAAERIIKVCRSYSKTGDFTVLILGKAKSAATMISFGANKLIMGKTAELGPIDPQLTLETDGHKKVFSICNIVKSYEKLFQQAVKVKGNLQPYLQQLANYDAREIEEFKSAIELSADIAVRTLEEGMMAGTSHAAIKKKIKIFLTPERTKTHGRPIYSEEASDCGINIEVLDIESEIFKPAYELYQRTSNYVSGKAAKCIENKEFSSIVSTE